MTTQDFIRQQGLLDSIVATLANTFGREWLRLSESDRALIVRDVTEEGGVNDLAAYRRAIGTGNLDAYVRTQRVRFAQKGVTAHTCARCNQGHTGAFVCPFCGCSNMKERT